MRDKMKYFLVSEESRSKQDLHSSMEFTGN